MAERRMFSKRIIDSDAFLDMTLEARLLYYDMAMRADDDGFVNAPKKIMRMIGASQEDLEELINNKFIIPFDNGVMAIKHWRVHNYIRKDTYNETAYKEQKALLEFDENNAYRLISDNSSTFRQRSVDGSSTQDRIGKVRLGKDKDIYSESKNAKTPYQSIIEQYNSICTRLSKVKTLSDARKKAIKARYEKYGEEIIIDVFKKANSSDFLCGEKDWIANFDWLMKDSNFVKVLDGNYDNKKKTSKAEKTETDIRNEEILDEYFNEG